jgi:hypothetical protein
MYHFCLKMKKARRSGYYRDCHHLGDEIEDPSYKVEYRARVVMEVLLFLRVLWRAYLGAIVIDSKGSKLLTLFKLPERDILSRGPLYQSALPFQSE